MRDLCIFSLGLARSGILTPSSQARHERPQNETVGDAMVGLSTKVFLPNVNARKSLTAIAVRLFLGAV